MVQSLKVGIGFKREMGICNLYITDVQSRASIRRLDFEIAYRRFMKLDQWPLGEFPDQMVAMLGMSEQTKDRDAGCLIFRKLNNQKRESYRKMINGENCWGLIKNGCSI